MTYLLLADVILLLHVLFVLFVVVGGVLTWRRPKVAWAHLPAAAWGVWVEWANWTCPLTPLEQWMRRQAGATVAPTDSVSHYLLVLLYPEELTRRTQIVLGLIVLLVNAILYLRLWASLRGQGRKDQFAGLNRP